MGVKNILARIKKAQTQARYTQNKKEAARLQKLRLKRISEEGRAQRRKLIKKEEERIRKAKGPSIANQLSKSFSGMGNVDFLGGPSKPKAKPKRKRRKTKKRKAYGQSQVIVIPPPTAPRKRRKRKTKKKEYDPFAFI